MTNSPEALYEHYRKSTGVSTDSRTLKEGNLFFALSGPNFNGNRFAEQALTKGASLAIIDDKKYLEENCILVDDALEALQSLAIQHRDRFKGPVLGITGSNGKTTTKELSHQVLTRKYKVQSTVGNLNNHIGIPLTILQWKEDTEIAIVEMGANRVGDIASYCRVAKPTHGLITNIGYAHTETFGGIEGVLRGKTELFDYLRRTDGTAFINTADDRLKHLTHRFNQPVTFPNKDLILVPGKEFVEFSLNEHRAVSKLTGDYNFSNIAAAVSLGLHFDVDVNEIVDAIAGYEPQNNRSQIIRKGTQTIILDAYNANPDSMRGALENLRHFDGEKIVFIGDMNELANSEEEHRTLGEVIRQLNLARVIFVGEKIRPALEANPDALHFTNVEEVDTSKIELPENAIILLKASRTIEMEKLLEHL